ncbi:MAG: hypothetical protein ACI4RF_07635, partial [Eubacterium sp.]
MAIITDGSVVFKIEGDDSAFEESLKDLDNTAKASIAALSAALAAATAAFVAMASACIRAASE